MENNEKIIRLESDMKHVNEQLKEHDKKINELSDVYIALTKVNDKVDVIDSDVKEIKTDLKKYKSKPAERIDNIVTSIISVLIGGLIGYFLTQIGLK